MSDDQKQVAYGARDEMTEHYRAFARLASDWFWELDENLCYCFHDGKDNSVTGLSPNELNGQSRIDVLNASLQPSAALTQHNEGLLNRESIDVILPFVQNGVLKHIHILAEPKFNEAKEFVGYIGCARDVSKRVRLEDELAHLATHDDLTGVINRREFEKRLGLLHQETELDGKTFSLCIIDLDRFKQVNDNGGHAAGDQLLRNLVVMIQKHLHTGETLGRLGGDEFGLLLRSDPDQAKKVVDKIIDDIARYEFVWEGSVFGVGASIGIAEISSTCKSVDGLLLQADKACYAAKNNGRNQSHLSDQPMVAQEESSDSTTEITDALHRQQFKLLMQPIIGVSHAEEYKRYELLIRLETDDGQMHEPAEFMPLAKRYSLVQELDFWVIDTALQALEFEHANGNDIALSINLSAVTLSDHNALNRIQSLLKARDIPENRLCFELTETFAIRNVYEVSQFMSTLRDDGVEFALDDIGDGFSSISYIQHLPISYLKIDGALIRKVANDIKARAVTQAFNDLSHRLGVQTIAESVEDLETIQIVAMIGIDFMQGFAVSGLEELETSQVGNKLSE